MGVGMAAGNRSEAGGLAHCSARLAFPAASGRGANHGPLRLGRRGQSPVNGYLYRSQPRQGTTTFHAYASACIGEYGRRYTLVLTWAQRHESMVRSRCSPAAVFLGRGVDAAKYLGLGLDSSGTPCRRLGRHHDALARTASLQAHVRLDRVRGCRPITRQHSTLCRTTALGRTSSY
jgi:hypothetical protein